LTIIFVDFRGGQIPFSLRRAFRRIRRFFDFSILRNRRRIETAAQSRRSSSNSFVGRIRSQFRFVALESGLANLTCHATCPETGRLLPVFCLTIFLG
jgi:hypothetical protein